MLALIPAWPQNVDELTRDAMLSLIGLFKQNQGKTEVLMLEHHNQFNYFLNHNHLLDLKYWDALDSVLGIKLTEGKPLAISDIEVPGEAELVYDNYGVNVFVNSTKVGRIMVEFNGLITQIEWQIKSTEKRIDIYDSRGFKISEQIKNEANQVVQQNWFNEYGEKRLTWDGKKYWPLTDDKNRFKAASYVQLSDLLTEAAYEHLTATKPTKIIATVADQQLTMLTALQRAFPITYLIPTNQINNPNLKPLLLKGQELLVPNQFELDQLVSQYGELIQAKIKVAYLFATQLNLGHSAEEETQKILWVVNDASNVEVFDVLTDWLANHPATQLAILATNPQLTNRLVTKLVEQLRSQFDFVRKIDPGLVADALQKVDKRDELQRALAKLQPNGDEKQLLVWLNEVTAFWAAFNQVEIISEVNRGTLATLYQSVRLVVDLNSAPDPFLQVAAISAGVPQITKANSPYSQHQFNGWVAKNLEQLSQGLHYFLDGLTNWNEALVANVDLINRFSSERLFTIWEEELHGE